MSSLLIHITFLFSAIQWTYQTCNEFGFYQTSDDKEKIFGDRFPIDFFIKQCTDIYGKNFNADYLYSTINNTNKYYGALHPSTTNVLYVHGSIDPWHALGITHSKDPRIPAIYIQGNIRTSTKSISSYIFAFQCFLQFQELLTVPICMNQKIVISYS